MDYIQITVLVLLAVFYTAYLIKALTMKRRGIAVNLLGKGEKPKSALIVERILRVATLVGAVVQFGSAAFSELIWSPSVALPIRIAAIALVLLGNLFFIIAMLTMRDNWRAGYNRNQGTKLVTRGIYKISRNPAFVGFDLLYIGCAVAFPNIVNISVAVAAVILFHIQILGEEKYCAETFRYDYDEYKQKTMRYIGKR